MYTEASRGEARLFLESVKDRVPAKGPLPYLMVLYIVDPIKQPLLKYDSFYILTDRYGIPTYKVYSYHFVKPQTYDYLLSKNLIVPHKKFRQNILGEATIKKINFVDESTYYYKTYSTTEPKDSLFDVIDSTPGGIISVEIYRDECG